MKTSTQLIIDLDAIGSNIQLIRTNLSADTRLMVMVKALGYGIDGVYLAPYLKEFGIDILGVAYPKEGVELRKAGVDQDIFVFNVTHYDIEEIINYRFEVAVSDEQLLYRLNDAGNGSQSTIKVHLHVDTGMSRLGCRVDQVASLAKLASELPWVETTGIMTHFACAENPDCDEFTELQLERFRSALSEIEQLDIRIPWKHAANSAATLRFQLSDCNLVRVGLAVYGLSSLQQNQETLPLTPAMTLKSTISGINTCKQGDTVSYGRRYQVKREYEKIAVIPIGYHDGLHRIYSGSSHVLIQGKRAPLVGAICMDHTMVDITDIPDAKIGDSVTIFGYDEKGNYLSPEELAKQGGTIPHELLACLGPRIERIYLENHRRGCYESITKTVQAYP